MSILLLINLIVGCTTTKGLEIDEDQSGINIRYQGVDRLAGLRTGGIAYGAHDTAPLSIEKVGDFVSVSLVAKGHPIERPEEFYGTFFDSIQSFKHGVTLLRYKPWNAWTKPVSIQKLSEMADWDIQFFYWQYEDGLYASAIPLSGNGYRTTLGQQNGKFGAKSSSLGPADTNQDTIPQMLIGFGDDPYALFEELFKIGLEKMGKAENRLANKVFPEKMDYIGWCTWNASDNGKLLTEDFVVESVKTFTDQGFPLGWVIVDDGWFDHENRMLNSLRPDSAKFPDGFSSLNTRLKEECDIREIGVWHTLNGYWNGIHVNSELGEKYRDELFAWETKPWAEDTDAHKSKTYHFIKPDSPALAEFYQEMHQSFKDQGFSFLKVDNQLVTEQMAPKNYPIFTLSEKMHETLNQSADDFFDGAVINCMDMTAEAYLNFGTSAIARAVEDYFPVEDNGVGYKLPYGNAAVHLTMAFYNSLYFQQMVYPDFDMFESHNPDGTFHAVARAINNGPIYITDKPGEQDFDILRKLCYSDGALIRPDQALTPTKDCLFQIQEAKPLKAFSRTGETGLLGAWNVSDTEAVNGQMSASDVYGIQGDEFVIYEYFSQEYWRVNRTELINIDLARMECKLFYIVPLKEQAAILGLVDKYNAPGTVIAEEIKRGMLKVTVADHGVFSVILPKFPKQVQVDGETSEFEFKDKLLTIEIEEEENRKQHIVEVKWDDY